MEGKKILLILVIIAAGVTGYVLVKEAKSTGSSSQNVTTLKSDLQDSSKKSVQNSGSQTEAVGSAAGTASSTENSQVAPQANNSTNNQKTMQLEIKTTQQGTGDRQVKAGDTVSVLYTGKLTDGTVFDASSRHGNQPFDFQVGAGMVIKGWDQGLLGAKVGEKRTLTIPSDLAYGPQGIPGVIPGGATLVFDVEVLNIK